MNRAERLEGYLETINQITEATKIALQTLNDNANTARMIAEEFAYGTADNIYSDLLHSHIEDEDIETDINAAADKIVKMIREKELDSSKIHQIALPIDPDQINPVDLMELVEKKLDELEKTEDNKSTEDIEDELNFNNPLE
ncbi:hypothetical protein LAV82_22680 [Bacillus sp. ILBB4]|nr:hypothetical protein [Bacillus sp. ILBB4]